MASLFHVDFLRVLWQHEVHYILVGGYSVTLHGYSRTTGDLAVRVEKSVDNYERLKKAFHSFGMPVFNMTAQNFLRNPVMDVFTFGWPLLATDIITQLKRLNFAGAFASAREGEVDGLPVNLIH